MKLITRETDYAIRSLAYIAKAKGKVVTASQLVKALKIPRPILRKLLQCLNKKGLLNSYKGSGGGFKLAVPEEKICIVDVMQVFQGQFALNECLFRKNICPNTSTCVLRGKINVIEAYVLDQLTHITLKDLL